MKITFNKRLQVVLAASGVSRETAARSLGVGVPLFSRWLSGTSVPDVYQFQKIAQFFGLPYTWFLGEDGLTAIEIAGELGLREETVQALMELAETEGDGVLEAVDRAVASIAAALRASFDDTLREIERGVRDLVKPAG